MEKFPDTENSILVRTDYSDQTIWLALREAILAAEKEHQFRAYLDIMDDPQFAEFTPQQIIDLMPTGEEYVFIVDHVTISHSERLILCIDYSETPPIELRFIPSEMWALENNLFVGNMLLSDFAEEGDDDGVFRGIATDS